MLFCSEKSNVSFSVMTLHINHTQKSQEIMKGVKGTNMCIYSSQFNSYLMVDQEFKQQYGDH